MLRTPICLAALALPLLGCFDPQPAAGLRCDQGQCPQGQFCASLDPDGDNTFEDFCQPFGPGGDKDAGITPVVFEPAQRIPLGTEPFQMIAEDIDADGIDDLIVSTGTNGVHVFLATGDGNFVDPRGSFPGGTQSFGIALADMNLDGPKDVVYLYRDDAGLQMAVALNQPGDLGSFVAIAATLVSADPLALGNVTVAHLDGDPNPDVFAWDFNAVGKAFVQDDPATPFPSTPTDLEIGGDVFQVLMADMNRDGLDDIITIGANGLSARLQQAGNIGSYLGGATYLGDSARWAVVTDVNRDQRTDIVLSTSNSIVTMIHSPTNNVYEDPIHTNASGLAQTTFDAADIDGDGAVDLVTQNGSLFFGDPLSVGSLRAGGRIQEEFFPNPRQVVLGNFGGNSKLDIAVLDGGQDGLQGFIQVFLQQ